MNKTKIEWCDMSWNPIKGWCPNTCPYCYSHRMYKHRGWDKNLRFDVKELVNIYRLKKPQKIFVGSMIDMYHESISQQWVRAIIDTTKEEELKQHICITLTKFPENLYKFDFPENWWIGVTVDHYVNDLKIGTLLANTTSHNKVFVSFEPLLTPINTFLLRKMDWIIVGGLTPKPLHEKKWVDDIVKEADRFNIPVFIKRNAKYDRIIEQFPET